MEAMKKIIEAEHQASMQVTEARAYKTMLLNQTKKKAEEQAQKALAEAESVRKQNEQEMAAELIKIDEELNIFLEATAQKINQQVSSKKEQLIKELIVEVQKSDR
jgi:small nuclear ribonucleoprotein (snRNP)-like protein